MSQLAVLVRSYNALDPAQVQDSLLPAQTAQGELRSSPLARRSRADRSCTGLVDKQWRLIDIVKELGEVLVSENDAVRSRGASKRLDARAGELTMYLPAGVGLLAATVKAMDRSTLDRQSSMSSSARLARNRADPEPFILQPRLSPPSSPTSSVIPTACYHASLLSPL